ADVYRYDDDLAGFYDYSDIGFFNKSNDVWNYWSPDNTNTEIAGLNVNNVSATSRSDHFLRDASYVRLRYVMVGYNFNAEQLNFLNLSGLRVYARSEEHTSELQSRENIVCRLLLEKTKLNNFI